MFTGIRPQDLDTYWDRLEPLIRKAVHNPRFIEYHGIEDVKQYIRDSAMQLWVGVDNDVAVAVVITQIIVYPKCKVFDLNFVGGEGIENVLEEGWGTLKKFGRSNGCKFIRGFGRKGWTRKLKEKPTYSVLWDLKL